MSWSPKKKTVSGNQVIDSSITFDNLGCTIDEDNMASDSATHVPTQQSVKAYVDANGGGGSSQWTTTGSDIYYNTGNVGIGTNSPDSALHVKDGDMRIESTFPRLYLADTNQNSDYSIINSDGSFSIYDDTNAVYRMRITSSGNVGIGTTTPSTPLHIHTDDPDFTQEIDSTATANLIEHRFRVDGVTEGSLLYNKADEYFLLSTTKELIFSSDSTERMRIDSFGRVGIGTTDPSSYNSAGDNLVIAETTGSAGMTFVSGTTNASHILFADSTTGTGAYDGFIKYSHQDLQMTFAVNAGVARMVIDSSGHVLVGTTETDIGYTDSGAGFSAHPDGYIQSARSSVNANLYLNKLDNDGEIINFRKDGTPVGSIGTSGSRPYFSNNVNDGIKIADDYVAPCNQTGADKDASLDLGSSSVRFKDLHLSGTGYFGTSVGIGTTSPARALHVTSGNDTVRLQSTGSNTKIEMVNTGSTTNEFGFLSNNFFVAPDGTEAMRIDSSGNVGIGTSSPSSKLHVQDSLGSPQIRIDNQGTGSGIASLMFHGGGTGNPTSIIQSGGANSGNVGIIFKHGNNGSETERMRIDSSGNVGIGITDPAFKLSIATPAIPTNSTYQWSLDLSRANDTARGLSFGIASAGTTTAIAGHNADVGIGHTFGVDANNLPQYYETLTVKHTDESVGKVGIGTTDPHSLLHVDGGDVKISSDSDTSNGDGKPAILFTETTADQVDAAIVYNGDGVSGDNNYVGIGVFDPTLASEDTLAEAKLATDLNITRNGRVGIGTTSPFARLSILGGSTGVSVPLIRLQTGGGGLLDIGTSDQSVANPTWQLQTGTGEELSFGDTSNEWMRIDSSGNVGIGTSDPAQKLDVSSAGTTRIKVTNTNLTSSGLYIAEDGTGAQINELGAYPIRFNTSGTERMRIDSSGNVLVGKTAVEMAAVGVEVKPAGEVRITSDNVFGLQLNRKTGDGEIINLRKDNTTVGSIGNSGVNLMIGNNDTGLGFSSSVDAVFPIDTTTGNNRSSAIDLGASTAKFKDLHLSGSGYFGGNVGIGTTDPQALLHLSAGTSGDATIIIEADTDNGNENDNPSIAFKQDGGILESQIGHTSYGEANQNALKIANSVSSGGIEFLTGTTNGASNASSRMFIDPDGKVGIGTVTPAENLDVSGNIAVRGTNPNIFFDETDTTNLNTSFNNSSGVFGIFTSNDANTTGTKRFGIDHSTGNVGIGDITPATALHVEAGTDIVSTFHSTNAGSYIKITDSNSGTYGALIGTIADEMVFSPNNAIAMRISADGDVAIGGAVDDEELLRVYGSSRTDVLGVNCNNSFAVLDVFSTVPQVGLFYTNSTTGSYITFEDANSTVTIPAAIGALGDECFIAAGGQERVRIDASGNVGIGETNPAEALDVSGNITATGVATLGGGSVSAPTYSFESDTNTGIYNPSNVHLGFVHQGIEKLRLTATGLGIGTTSPDKLLDVSYYKNSASSSAVRVQTTNTNYNGRLIDFYKGTNHHGNIGLSTVSYGQGVNLTSQAGGIRACNQFGTVRVSPCTGDGSTNDDSVDLGESYNSFDDIYATNGTIQTSDRNRKQDIEELTDAERRVAVACKGLLRKFRWISAVEEKGDDARIHFGIIAQDLQDAFTAEGLDAGKYAMFISNTWWVHEGLEYEQDAPEGAIEKTRLGVRYPELLAFIIAAL